MTTHNGTRGGLTVGALKTLSLFVHLRLKKELVEKLDDFRFTQRFESRTEAIHWLLEFAVSQNPKPKK